MTLGTLSTGFLIAVVAVAIELLDRDNKKEQERFINFE